MYILLIKIRPFSFIAGFKLGDEFKYLFHRKPWSKMSLNWTRVHSLQKNSFCTENLPQFLYWEFIKFTWCMTHDVYYISSFLFWFKIDYWNEKVMNEWEGLCSWRPIDSLTNRCMGYTSEHSCNRFAGGIGLELVDEGPISEQGWTGIGGGGLSCGLGEWGIGARGSQVNKFEQHPSVTDRHDWKH